MYAQIVERTAPERYEQIEHVLKEPIFPAYAWSSVSIWEVDAQAYRRRER